MRLIADHEGEKEDKKKKYTRSVASVSGGRGERGLDLGGEERIRLRGDEIFIRRNSFITRRKFGG